MPTMPASPPTLIERFDAAALQFPDAQRRKMFGYPALFVGGNMATGLHGTSWVVRLSEADRDALLAEPGASVFEPMAGRPMKAFAVLPDAVVADDAQLDRWVERSMAFAASLPPK